MDHANSLISPKGRWLIWFMKIGMMGMLMLSRKVNSEDQMGIPAAGLLCISDCATCPMICSPPPPPLQSHPPPSHHPPPPQSYYHSPPAYSFSPPPPSSPNWQPPHAPSWYPSWGTPPPYYYQTPTGQGPPTQGQNAYPYPYYYFYASKASSFSLHASIFFSLLFFNVVNLFC